MTERRSFERQLAEHDVVFSVTEVMGGFASSLERRGKVVDFSERGFGLETEYPLKRGHIITIKQKALDKLPTHGRVLWSKRVNGKFRAGLKIP
ncbi:MAG: PilZ domain-containing protein [Nitrospirae bacterium]|nr:MAG: PilZ domain-containing protein [Nitrospirota bacterium]